MTGTRGPGVGRRLVYIPIVHTPADMGALGSSIEKVKLSALGREQVARQAAAIGKMWEAIEQWAAGFEVVPGRTRVYQDGLPVCGREVELVSELAEAGNRNHRLLLSLQARGAVLLGTESPELLVEEYQLAAASLAGGAAARSKTRHTHLKDTLLERRDRFAADRINQTLEPGETGILFMGMLHSVAKWLAPDIEVIHPLWRPGAAKGRRG